MVVSYEILYWFDFVVLKNIIYIYHVIYTFKMTKKIDTYLFIEAWESERYLWDVNSDIYKNRYEKGKELPEVSGTI